MPTPTPHIPRWVSIVLGVTGVALCFGVLLVIRSFDLYTADVRDEGIAVWVHTPHVAPGDRLTMEVGLFGGRRAAIDHIVVRGEGIAADVVGLGKDWGGVISTKSGEVGQDSQKVFVDIPKAAQPGKTLILQVEATGTIAESSGYSMFSDRSAIRLIEVPIEVLAEKDKPWRKLYEALRGLAAFAAAFLAFRFSLHPVMNFIGRADREEGSKGVAQSLASLGIGLSIVYVMAGLAYFAHPLRHATALLGDAWTVAFVLSWVALPPYLGWKLAGPAREPPTLARLRAIEPFSPAMPMGYREIPTIARPRLAPVLEIVAALAKIPGARVRERGEEIQILRKGKPRELVLLTVPRDGDIGAGDIVFRYDGSVLAIEAAHALALALGPLELTLGGVALSIDGSKEPSEIVAFWSKEMIERMQRVLRSV